MHLVPQLEIKIQCSNLLEKSLKFVVTKRFVMQDKNAILGNIRIFTLLTLLLTSYTSYAQNFGNDFGEMATKIYVRDSSNLPIEAKSILLGKIRQTLKLNGFSINSTETRFIITASVQTVSKEIIEQPSPLTNQEIMVRLTFGNALTKQAFSHLKLNLKGTGVNEKRSFIEAFKTINPKSNDLKSFMEQGQREILQYYKLNCDSLLKESQQFVSKNKFIEAIQNVYSVPEGCSSCHFRSIDTMITIYQKKIDFECKKILDEAKIIWSYSQTEPVANKVLELLKSSNPLAKNQDQAIQLLQSIGTKLKPNEKIKWQEKTKIYGEKIVAQKQILNELELTSIQGLRNKQLDDFWINLINESFTNQVIVNKNNKEYESIIWK